MWAMKEMELTTGGPNTHDGPHETPAAWTAARKTILHTIKLLLISDLYKYHFFHLELNNFRSVSI